MAISPGQARGRVKCLNTAHEKSIDPGDILVAFTTDPGWTPLFVNAAAIVLEVGGVLQHGALVAREFNKPCVAGISDIFTHLHDGQLVEVDGEHGTVSVIDEASLPDERPALRTSPE
jgi:pyruvate,water dikinase